MWQRMPADGAARQLDFLGVDGGGDKIDPEAPDNLRMRTVVERWTPPCDRSANDTEPRPWEIKRPP